MGYRVLIVDDSSTARSMLKIMLEEMGHQVVAEAGTSRAAVAAYGDVKPDLVLMDVSLPGEDGLHALETIRGIDPKANVAVLTGNEQKLLRQRALGLGALDILYKPYTTDKLAAFLKTLSVRPRGGA